MRKDGKPGDKSLLERVSKDRSMKKKKAGKPSEIEGMDVKTKESAEKLASDLVEVIKGLPADTRPEDIFEGVRDRFRTQEHTSTRLYAELYIVGIRLEYKLKYKQK